jgi:hypothetical protein
MADGTFLFRFGCKAHHNLFFSKHFLFFFTLLSVVFVHPSAIRRPLTWPAVAVVVRSYGRDAPTADRMTFSKNLAASASKTERRRHGTFVTVTVEI